LFWRLSRSSARRPATARSFCASMPSTRRKPCSACSGRPRLVAFRRFQQALDGAVARAQVGVAVLRVAGIGLHRFLIFGQARLDLVLRDQVIAVAVGHLRSAAAEQDRQRGAAA
jgi:hypothetical protein